MLIREDNILVSFSFFIFQGASHSYSYFTMIQQLLHLFWTNRSCIWF